MKAEDLMVGDYLTFTDVQNDSRCPKLKVVVIDGATNELLVSVDGDPTLDRIDIDDELCGIPITPEILEKNGFEKLDFSHFQIGDRRLVLDADGRWDGPLSWHWVVTEMDTNAKGQPVVLDYYVATINHVHELQNAMRLCGIDKTIEL